MIVILHRVLCIVWINTNVLHLLDSQLQINLLYLKFQDDQPDVQGLAVLLSSERYATNSPIGMWHKHHNAFHTVGLKYIILQFSWIQQHIIFLFLVVPSLDKFYAIQAKLWSWIDVDFGDSFLLPYCQLKFVILCSEYSDVAAYRLSLGEDTKAINQLVCSFLFSLCVHCMSSLLLYP